jgi:hypothetical protein
MRPANAPRTLVAAALLILVAGAGARGDTLHVAESGDDAAAGTEAAPLLTIQKAVARARAGDTIVVHGGRYTGHVIRNNLFFAPDRRLIGEAGTPPSVESNIEQQAPRFADPERFDFRLHPQSPAIDAGLAEGAPPTDIAGTARPQGTGIDLGAYERRD